MIRWWNAGCCVLVCLTTAALCRDADFERALRMMGELDYPGALAAFRQLAERPDPDPAIYFQMGACQTVLGQYSAALESFRQATEAGLAESWQIWSARGIAHFNLERFPEARRAFERVLGQEPDEFTSLFFLGRLDLEGGELDAAEARFRRVIQLESSYEPAFYYLGRTLIRKGKTAEGKRILRYHQRREHLHNRLRTLTDLARSENTPAEIYAEMAGVYLDLGSRQQARKALHKAEEIAPATELTRLVRGRLSYLDGNFDLAEEHLAAYLKIESRKCDAHHFLGLALKAQRKFSAAARVLRRASDLCPPEVSLLASLAEVEIQNRNLLVAVALADKITKLDPAAAEGPFLKAVSSLYRHDLQGAEKWALRALHLEQENPEYHRLLEAIYRNQGDTEKADLHRKQMEILLSDRKSSE